MAKNKKDMNTYDEIPEAFEARFGAEETAETKSEFIDLGKLEAVPYEVDRAEVEMETSPKQAVQKKKSEPNTKTASLNVFKMYPSATTPEHKTKSSGCFDFEVYLGPEIKSVKAYDYANREYQLKIQDNATGRYIAVPFGNRVLLPTGLVFAIPTGFALSLIARSSAGFKKGLVLSQGLGYVDEDYREEVFIPITVTAHSPVRIDHKERIAQGYIAPWYRAEFNVLEERPGSVTDRVGGFGSTN